MSEIMKGWVTLPTNHSWSDDTIYLYKSKDGKKELSIERDIKNFVSNALNKLGFDNKTTDNDFERGENTHFIADNIMIQIFSSDVREPLETIQKKEKN